MRLASQIWKCTLRLFSQIYCANHAVPQFGPQTVSHRVAVSTKGEENKTAQNDYVLSAYPGSVAALFPNGGFSLGTGTRSIESRATRTHGFFRTAVPAGSGEQSAFRSPCTREGHKPRMLLETGRTRTAGMMLERRFVLAGRGTSATPPLPFVFARRNAFSDCTWACPVRCVCGTCPRKRANRRLSPARFRPAALHANWSQAVPSSVGVMRGRANCQVPCGVC